MTIPSTKNWMHIPGPGRLARLTQQQADFMKSAMAFMVKETCKGMAHDVSTAIEGTVRKVIDDYPKDGSCATCDFEREGYCLHWKEQIPAEHFESGCNKHRVQGAPF